MILTNITIIMTKIMNWLKGRRTYILCGLTIIFALLGLYLGKLDWTAAFAMITSALSLVGVRFNQIPPDI